MATIVQEQDFQAVELGMEICARLLDADEALARFAQYQALVEADEALADIEVTIQELRSRMPELLGRTREQVNWNLVKALYPDEVVTDLLATGSRSR